MDPSLYPVPEPEPNPLSPLYRKLNDTLKGWKQVDKSLRQQGGSNSQVQEELLLDQLRAVCGKTRKKSVDDKSQATSNNIKGLEVEFDVLKGIPIPISAKPNKKQHNSLINNDLSELKNEEFLSLANQLMT